MCSSWREDCPKVPRRHGWQASRRSGCFAIVKTSKTLIVGGEACAVVPGASTIAPEMSLPSGRPDDGRRRELPDRKRERPAACPSGERRTRPPACQRPSSEESEEESEETVSVDDV